VESEKEMEEFDTEERWKVELHTWQD